MPLPSHRLDLLLVASGAPDAVAFDAFVADLRARGVVDDRARGAASAAWLVPGGFRRVVLDDPGDWRLFANQQGGFRVRCPGCGANLVPALSQGWSGLRGAEPAPIACPACGSSAPIGALDFAPPAAWGRWAVRLVECEHAAPSTDGLALAEATFGPLRVVAARVG